MVLRLSTFQNDVLQTLITGLSTATSSVITVADSVLTALGKLQSQISLRAPIASPTFTGTVTAPAVNLDGGTIDGTLIGSSVPSSGVFTTITATGLTINTLPVINSSNTFVSYTLAGGLAFNGTTLTIVPSSIPNTPVVKTAAYTFLITDHNTRIQANSTTAIAFTCNSLTAGTLISVENIGTGKPVFTAGTGVTITYVTSASTNTATAAGSTGTVGPRNQYSRCEVVWITTTSVIVRGDIV